MVMIPGAREKRVARPPLTMAQSAATPHAGAATVDDRERFEHEREGGGAPSERTGMPRRTILARLGEWLRNAAER
jgi:hypothetical protein